MHNMYQSKHGVRPSNARRAFVFERVIDDIYRMPWERLSNHEVLKIAKVYYYFSIQFRENLTIACQLHPHDENLKKLYREEVDTDNLSPFPGITKIGERVNHDEFMKRLLLLTPVSQESLLEQAGMSYLLKVRQIDANIRAKSIASYEDGGLSTVFSAMLRAPTWQGAGQQAFRFFLEEHIKFDTDVDEGHGALSRHLGRSDDILPLWIAFRELLMTAAPVLAEAPPDIEATRRDPGFRPRPVSLNSVA